MFEKTCENCSAIFQSHKSAKRCCSMSCRRALQKMQMNQRHATPLTIARLREVLNYDPETGVFIWRGKIADRVTVGTVAGCLDRNGYVKLRLYRKLYLGHHLAWAHYYGEWPTYLDHINQDKHDNRIANLRSSTHAENCRNQSKRKRNPSYKGTTCRPQDKRWIAMITVNFQAIYIGTYDTAEEAARAYNKAALKYHGEFACLNDLGPAKTSEF